MAATIKDIAKLTGLGLATVSAHINGVNVRPRNKEAIDKAIQDLGYVRNEYARGLKMHKSMTIGVLIPELSNIFSTTIISEMEDVLRMQGYGIIVCDCRSNKDIEVMSVQFLLSKMVDGLIIMPISSDCESLSKAHEANIPVVVIDRMTDSKKAAHIIINNREVSEAATSKLIERGHRKIAIITGNQDIYTARERFTGYRDALEKCGLYDNTLFYNGGLSVENGYLAMKQLISERSDVTALFVTNYEMTVGAIIAINEFGKKIPDDYSFVGFDNMELSKVISPSLATINQPLKEIGRQSANKILDLMQQNGLETVVLEAEFDEGESIKRI